MKDKNYKVLATNPVQYDSDELHWDTETIESPIRQFFSSYLKKNLGDLSNKKVIDIGSGTGYLTKLYEELGTRDIFGLEPSKSNVRMSRTLNPDMKVIQSPLEDFNSENNFDVAVSVMVFGHIADPQAAFRKIFNLLQSDGSLFLIITDKAHSITPRFGYEIEIQTLDNGEIASMTKRSQGVMYDVLRPIENYIRYATNVGFKFTEEIPLIPTEELKEKDPRYMQFQDVPIGHLMVFKKYLR